ncbi:arsenate reductase ArsC [Candidatus Poribacteria bacterium]|nr:arsenate reductase ArsC [Candidatus Poribacteria bacterium]
MKKAKVLFICTGNSARSQMSEGLLRKMAGDITDVYSAGTKPSEKVNPFALKMLSDSGIDTSGHYTKSVTEFLDKEFDIIITVCDNARQNCPVFPGKAVKYHWNLEDPASVEGTEEEKLEVFRNTFADISKRVSELIDMIKNMPKKKEKSGEKDLGINL